MHLPPILLDDGDIECYKPKKRKTTAITTRKTTAGTTSNIIINILKKR